MGSEMCIRDRSITSTPRAHEFWLVDEHLKVEHVHALYRMIVYPWICWSSFSELCRVSLPSYANCFVLCNKHNVQINTYYDYRNDRCDESRTYLVGLDLLFILLAGFTVHRLLIKDPGRWNRFDWDVTVAGGGQVSVK